MMRASIFRLSPRLLMLAAALAVLFAFGGAAPAQAQATDYDSDDDGLISVSSLAQLDAIRWDLDGDGSASDAGYAAAFPNPATGMGCPSTGCAGYELAASLDFDTNGSGDADDGDAYWNGGHGWLPLGIDGDPFSAIFEGNGRVISNLYIATGPEQQSDATGVPVSDLQPAHFGLFEEVGATGAIRNVGLEDVDVSREHYCHSRPQIICNQGRVGGLAGVSHGKINGSWVTGAVSNTATGGENLSYWRRRDHFRINIDLTAGGLVGFAGSSSVISNSYSAAAVHVHADWLPIHIKGGGLAGHNAGSIIASYAIGEVYSDRPNTQTTRNNFRDDYMIGGLVGYNSGPITASYARGAVSGPPQFRVRSGLVGYGNGSPTITASYWDTVASGQSESHAGVGRTTAQLQAPTGYSGIYANWNVDLDGDGSGDDPWAFGTASQYPVLKSLGVTKQRGLTPGSVPRIDYDSDDDGLIEISRSSQLLVVRGDPNGDGSPGESRYDHWRTDYYDIGFFRAAEGMGCPQTGCIGYEVVSDLSMGNAAPDIGGYSVIFEGNGHTIIASYGPMIETIEAGGVVRNLTLKGSGASSRQPNVGGLAGVNHGAISNVHVAGSLTAWAGVGGGLVGVNGPTGTISDSSSAGRVVDAGYGRGWDIGGLVGRNAGSIRSSYSTARADGKHTSNMGGLVGHNTSTGSIRGSYARGAVRSEYLHGRGHPHGRNLGGLVGNNEGEITVSYSTGRVSNCGACPLHRGDEPMGGLVGLNNGGTVRNSYWDTETSRWTTSAGGVGRTTEQLQQPWKAVYQGIYADWNLDLDGDGSPDDPWDFGAPDQYPKLKSPEQREQGVKTFILTPYVRFLEGRSTELTITLNRPAPAGGVEFTVAPSFNDAALRDEVASIASPVTVAAGNTTAAIAIAHSPDDRLDEPDKTFTVTVAAATAGWRKAGAGWDTATVVVGDDDPPGLRYERKGGRLGEPSLRIAEGGTGTYRLSMASRLLTNNVTVTATSGDPGALTVSPASHTFTPSDWDTPKTFTVRGVADADANDEIVGIEHRMTKQGATDSRYSGHVVVAVSDTDAVSPQRQQPPGQDAPADYADLIARMKEWRNDPQWVSEKAHTDRWDRALLAFGETVADTSLTPMTAAEAQGFADRGWERWVEVAQALRELQNRAPTVSAAIADIAIVSEGVTREVSLSGVFDDADGDALIITAASSDERIATVAVADPSARAIIEVTEGAATMSVSADPSSLTLTGQVPGTATVTVTAHDGRGGAASADFVATVESGTPPEQEETTSGDYAGLIARMKEWRNDPQWVSEKAHTDRWDRALLAFGETVADSTLTPMTAAEAQGFADRGSAWSRWVEVAAALREIESAGQQQQEQPNRAPTVSATIADVTIVNQSGTRTVSLSGVFSDADSDALTVTAASSDGAVATVSVAADGSSLTVSAQARGTATITVTADDGNGGTVEDAFTVTVKAAPVVASALADVSGLEVGATQEVSLSGVFSDADGDALTITAASSDETKATVSVASDGSKLTLTGVAEGTATITVAAEDSDGNRVSGTFEATVPRKYAALIAEMYQWRNDPEWVSEKAHTDRWDRALLAFGETVADTTLTPMTAAEAQGFADRGWERWVVVAQALREIEGGGQQEQANRAPTVSAAIADVTIVNESGTQIVSLSGVFDDADGDSLTVSAASSDGAIATVSVASDYSSLTVNAQARGTATITATADDGNGGTASDTFTVTVKAAPVASSALADLTGLEEAATQEVSLSGAFSDADGDTLTITAASGDEAITTVSVVSDGSKLRVAGVTEGTATITVTAQDSDGNRVSDTFDVSVVAPPPPATPNLAPTVSSAIADVIIVNESGTRQVSLSGVFSDADNDALTVTAASSDEAVATVSVAAGYSSLTVNAQGRGTATITVTADDGNGGTVSDAFTVTVKAAPVVASAISDVSGLVALDTQEVSLVGVFSDADGDRLTISAASSDAGIAMVSVASDGSKLTLSGVAQGTATITVTAQDSDGNRASDTFDVAVEPEPEQDSPPDGETPNRPPTVAQPLPDVSLEGLQWRQFSLADVFHDPDGDELTFTVVSSDYGVASMWVSGSTLTVVATSTGTATITVTAEDPEGNRVSDELQVTVRPAS